MAVNPRPDEPVVVYAVRELLDDMRRDLREWMMEVSSKLDDRVTVGVFKAVRSDLDAAVTRLGRLEELAATAAGEARERSRVSDRTIAWAALVVALLGSLATIAWLIHG